MYKAKITYDGTCYFGWQKTKSGPSIQEELQIALYKISGESCLPQAASRTDRGVHAKGQVVQFALKKKFKPKTLQKALNAHLPSDIRILELEQKDFHPTLDAIGKEYHYHLCLTPVQEPHKRLYSWHLYQSLDFEKIMFSTKHLIGTHDFSAFSNCKEKNPICTIESITFDQFFQIRADRFLYKMARNLIGSLVYIGLGKFGKDCIPNLLASKARKNGGITAPAHGLYLHQVFYPIE